MVTAIILAAGKSGRMGMVNKLFLPWEDKTIIETTVISVLNTGLKEVIVITGYEAEKLEIILNGYPVKLIQNKNYLPGLTSSIQCGAMNATGEGLMFCLADMVTVETYEYSFLIKQFGENHIADPECICVPLYDQRQGNPVIFSSYYKPHILAHTGKEGCKEILLQNKKHIHWIEMQTNHILQDVDTREEYERLRKM